MSSFNGRLGGGSGQMPKPPEYQGPLPDQWGRPREGEDVPTWYAREFKSANAKYKGSIMEGKAPASPQACQAYERHTWNAELKAGRDEFAAKEAKEAAAAEAERQVQLIAARQAKAVADRREEEDKLLAWHESQARARVPGRL